MVLIRLMDMWMSMGRVSFAHSFFCGGEEETTAKQILAFGEG
jgi:hypothetical protein